MNASSARAGQQRRLPGQLRQELPACLLQLGDVSPGVRAKVGAERGRGADTAEQGIHRAVPQQVHVIDAVRAGRHARDQAGNLQVRVHPHSPAGRTCSATRLRQPGALRQGHHRHQARVRHQIRVVERCVRPRQDYATIALTRCPLEPGNWKLRQLPSSQLRGHLSR